MWAAWVVAAIAWAGAGFLLTGLIALLREGAPAVCYWVVPFRPKPVKEVRLKVLGGIYSADDCGATECNRVDYDLEFLENEGHAEEKYDSGLIAPDVRPFSDGLGWRPGHPRRGYVLREHRL